MAMYKSPELEAIETCPYNPSHTISGKRFTVHLVKCRKSNANVEKVTCPFYAEHKVPKPELAYHMSHCEKSKDFHKEVFQEEPKTTRKFEVIGGDIKVECEESWTTQDTPTYNPQAYCEQSNIIRQLKVEPTSVRKTFKQVERERHQMLDRQAQAKQVEKSKQQVPVKREDSTRYDSSVSDILTTVSEQLSKFSLDETSTVKYDQWTKVHSKRGRGRGGGKRT